MEHLLFMRYVYFSITTEIKPSENIDAVPDSQLMSASHHETKILF